MKGLDKMIDQSLPREDSLIQINAVKSALHKGRQVVLEGHLHP
ncbi:MAG: metal-sensing transcriptional repressor [Spirochaetaceae bacterium]|nr:metal-sensing transcriptional repressor [Spirochaetaceae bacterium]